jgi:hypothetical protein
MVVETFCAHCNAPQLGKVRSRVPPYGEHWPVERGPFDTRIIVHCRLCKGVTWHQAEKPST